MSNGLQAIAAAALIMYGAHGCHEGWNGFGWLIFLGLYSGPWTADYLETQIENVSPVYLRRRLRVLRRNEIVAYDPQSRTWRTR